MFQRAIAIQQQTYVIAAAQYGEHYGGRSSWGESVAFDPWGKPLGRLRSFDDTPSGSWGSVPEIEEIYKTSGEYFLCDIDLSLVQETRKQIPLAMQKRTDMYGVVGESLPPKKAHTP